MMKNKKKQTKKAKPRNLGVLYLIERGGHSVMKDRRKEANKKACRKKVSY